MTAESLPDLAAIVARDKEPVEAIADMGGWGPFLEGVLADRHALLELVGELAHALGTVGECHGCIHNDNDEAERLLAYVEAVR